MTEQMQKDLNAIRNALEHARVCILKKEELDQEAKNGIIAAYRKIQPYVTND